MILYIHFHKFYHLPRYFTFQQKLYFTKMWILLILFKILSRTKIFRPWPKYFHKYRNVKLHINKKHNNKIISAEPKYSKYFWLCRNISLMAIIFWQLVTGAADLDRSSRSWPTQYFHILLYEKCRILYFWKIHLMLAYPKLKSFRGLCR